MGHYPSGWLGPSPLQVVRLRSLLLAVSWLWLDALACTSSFYLTSLGSQCFLVLVGLCPLSCVQCTLFACAFLLYNLLLSSLVAGLFAFFLYLLWHRVLCSCICSFAFLISPSLPHPQGSICPSGSSRALLEHRPKFGHWKNKRCQRVLHRCLRDFAISS